MFKNKAKDGRNNLCGKRIGQLREAMGLSQRELAERLQIEGLDVDKNAIQRTEAGKRFVTDVELVHFARVLNTSVEELLNTPE